jgi:MoaA/NifB/PqqE/SkfB family radical SAM enzyme
VNNGNVHKSADVLVTKTPSGLRLIHQPSGLEQILAFEESIAWLEWNEVSILKNRHRFSEPFVIGGASYASLSAPYQDYSLDSVVPIIKLRYVKWYEESPDLCILFNSEIMNNNNPLLALGPFGSLCWRGIISKWPIGRIRKEAIRVFGDDEVDAFLKRLVNLGFIDGIPFDDLSKEEIITKEFLAPHVQFQLFQARIPWYCLWEISTNCNLRCKSCYLPSFGSEMPATKDSLSIVREIVRAGIFYVSILGGEPLLRNDLEQIVYALRSNGVFVKIITNGLLLSTERARSLREAQVNQIELSFDGISDSTHDSVRGEGTHALAIGAIEAARDAGIQRIGIVLTLNSENFKELEFIPGFLNRLQITECYLSLFRKTGKEGGRAPFNPLDDRSVKKIHSQIKLWKESFPSLEITLLSECTCGRTSVVVSEEGNVRACPFSPLSAGNLFKTSLADIWRTFESVTSIKQPLGYCSTFGRFAI